MSLDKAAVEKLDAPFDEGRVKTKKVPGRPDASYLESFDVINKANAVFGYGGWGTEIKSLELREAGGKTACVVVLELLVEGCEPRQDVGVNVAAQKRDEPLTAEALETSIKGAVSDALKRALRHYGTQFGNQLYDKERDAGNGQKAPRRAAPKAKGDGKGGKLGGDPVTVLWAYAKSHGLKAETVQEQLALNDNDASKALVRLRELCGEA